MISYSEFFSFFTLLVISIISRMLSFHLLVFSDSCVTGNGSWCSHSSTFFCHLLHGELLCTSSWIGQYRGRWVIRIYVWLGFLRHFNVTGLYHNTNTEQNRKHMYNVTVLHFQLFSLFVKFNPRTEGYNFFFFPPQLCTYCRMLLLLSVHKLLLMCLHLFS